MRPLQRVRHPAPPCTQQPEMFDRIHDEETHVQANTRMAAAANLCKTACDRLEECWADKRKRPDWTNGVVAGGYRPHKVPRSRKGRA